ncbi:MAG: DegT/DnrJ/EryC1/StrS family aminotransferase [Flavobacteriales bacterium]|nr:DegT/DnrJ/EryC1/StrS family aminotransferase [Flavobacteriales bacterium]
MSKNPLYVTKSFLPPVEEYTERIKAIWESGQLTNQGTNLVELEKKLQDHLAVKHLFAVSNGTLALQVAFKALELTGDVITTPFSYVATVSSLAWEGLNPVFVDIKEDDLCIDPAKIEASITPSTSAILATHVYGFPCDVVAIEKIAAKHNLKVIYDAAHAFDVTVNSKSVLAYGDASTLSFHATKIFHSGEGGAIVTPHADVAHKIGYMRNFGHNGPEAFQGIGINAKVSEVHAALGLCVLPHMQTIIAHRQQATQQYDALLSNLPNMRVVKAGIACKHNYAYYPVLFNTEEVLTKAVASLNAASIFPRRYFFPSLETLPYVGHYEVPISRSISSRILCLPLSAEISEAEVSEVAAIIRTALTS